MALDKKKLAIYARDPMEFFRDAQYAGERFGDIADESQIKWLESIAPTLLALARGRKAAIRRFLLEATKGWAKTGLVSLAIAWLIIFAPRALLIVVLARDLNQGLEFVKASKEFRRENRIVKPLFEVQRDKVLNPKTETVAEVWTADDLGRHGGRPNLTWIDEYTHIDDHEYVNTALDNAAKVATSAVILSGNAGFKASPAFKLREIYRKGGPGYSFFQYSQPAPWLSADDLLEAEQRNSRSRYLRLFWSIWSSGSDSPVTPEDIQHAITMAGPLETSEEGWQVASVGLDIGVKNVHSACVGLAVKHGSARIRLAFCESWKPDRRTGEVDLGKVRSYVIQMHRKWRFGCLWYDPSQALLMAQDVNRLAGVPIAEMTFAGKNLNVMAESLLTTFRCKTIDLYEDKELIADLGRLDIEERAWGHKLTAPSDAASGHCDRAMALAIALPAGILAANRAGYRPIEMITSGRSQSRDPRKYGIALMPHTRRCRDAIPISHNRTQSVFFSSNPKFS